MAIVNVELKQYDVAKKFLMSCYVIFRLHTWISYSLPNVLEINDTTSAMADLEAISDPTPQSFAARGFTISTEGIQ